MRKPGWTLILILCLTRYVTAQTFTSSVFYTTPNRGGTVIETTGDSQALVVGYARVQPSSSTAPTGAAIIGFRVGDTLVSEAGVRGTTPILAGRTFAEVNGPVNTGIAFANPNPTASLITFHFTDDNGNDFGQSSFTLGANAQLARFLDQAPFNASRQFAGTLTFSASVPVTVIALRGVLNSRNEFLISTQIVTPLPGTVIATPVVIGQFVDGGGWRTQVILINTTDANLTGIVQFFGTGTPTAAAGPLTLDVNGQSATSFNYTIRPRSAVKMVTSGPVGVVPQVGSVRIAPTSGSRSPAGFAVSSFTNLGILQTEAAVPVQSTGFAFRTSVEMDLEDDGPDPIQTAIAITNTATTTATIHFELTSLDGTNTGLTAIAVVPANGHISTFVRTLFPALDLPFRGILRINSGVSPVVVTSLRTRINERNDFIITATPVSNEATPATNAELFFPHLADGGGYTTDFVLFSGITGQSTQGNLRFFSPTGQAMNLPVR